MKPKDKLNLGEIPKVYVNRTLNLRKIKYIGFDMDHTLIRYNSREFEALAFEKMVDKLVTQWGYPERVRLLEFDYDRAIRGLVMDRKKGNLLKVSRHCAIRVSYHGTRLIDYKTQQQMFRSTYIDLSEPEYMSIDTAFSIAFAALFAQLVDLKDTTEAQSLPDYDTIAEDLMAALDQAHRDGSLKNTVRDNLSKYIVKDKSLVEGLERYKKHDKKLFVLTNSDFHYTKILLDYAIDPFLKDHKSWMELFELVITGAQKPRFFYDDLKFLNVNPADGSMTNQYKKLTKGIYQGGCARIFTNDLQLQGDDILYIGDHIYGDILRLKKDCNWRTAMVIEELGQEIKSFERAIPIHEEIEELMFQKEPMENRLVDLFSSKIEKSEIPDEKEVHDLQNKIGEIDRRIGALIGKHQTYFNPYWGEIMRAGNEESYFAHQVDRFACIYMEKLADLLELSPRTYFRARRRPLAHELSIEMKIVDH